MTTRFIDHLITGDHASRPAANAVPDGTLYSCTTHSLVYQSDGASWSTWANLSGTGSMATDSLWDAKGDLAAGTGANAAAILTAGANGMVPVYDSAQSQGLKTAYPPGYEFDYAQITSPVSITATSEGSAVTVVSGNSVTYDGSTIVIVEFYAPFTNASNTAVGENIVLCLIDSVGPTNLGRLALSQTQVTASPERHPVHVSRRLTPSAAAHTYSIAAWASANNSGSVNAGTGGNGNSMPAYIRIFKAN